MNYQHCTNTIDSVGVRLEDLNKTLRELDVGESIRMSSIVKTDNAAKAYLSGCAAVVKSKYKLEDWERALKYDPDLGIYDEDDDEKVFGVFITEGPGSLSKDGVEFSSVPDEEGYATVTLLIDPTEENKKELFKAQSGLALVYLNEVE